MHPKAIKITTPWSSVTAGIVLMSQSIINFLILLGGQSTMERGRELQEQYAWYTRTKSSELIIVK